MWGSNEEGGSSTSDLRPMQWVTPWKTPSSDCLEEYKFTFKFLLCPRPCSKNWPLSLFCVLRELSLKHWHKYVTSALKFGCIGWLMFPGFLYNVYLFLIHQKLIFWESWPGRDNEYCGSLGTTDALVYIYNRVGNTARATSPILLLPSLPPPNFHCSPLLIWCFWSSNHNAGSFVVHSLHISFKYFHTLVLWFYKSHP